MSFCQCVSYCCIFILKLSTIKMNFNYFVVVDIQTDKKKTFAAISTVQCYAFASYLCSNSNRNILDSNFLEKLSHPFHKKTI